MNPDYTQIVNAINRLIASQQKGVWDYAGTLAIIATLVVIIWYTVETFQLRKTTQRQAEYAVMPIVSFQSVRGDDGVLFDTWRFTTSILAIRNVGSGPAFNVEVEPLSLGDKKAVFIHSRTLAPGEVSAVKIVGLLGPATQDPFGQVSQTRIEQTGDLLRHLQKLQGSGETQGEITYVSLAGKRYRTTFTMNHTLDAESFVRFGSVKAV